jgi:hypothetical protein
VTGAGEDAVVGGGGVSTTGRCPCPLRFNTGRRTARRITATVATVAAWTAVAGIGTYGTFPGSTQSLASQRGHVSLALAGSAGSTEVPLEFSGLVPGGAVTQAVTLVNDGRADLSAVTVSTVIVESSLLDTDPTDGLQLAVDSCSVAWTPEWTCPGEWGLLVAPGPVRRRTELQEPASRAAGARDHLAVTVTLPETAGNEFNGLRSELVLTFTGLQRVAPR